MTNFPARPSQEVASFLRRLDSYVELLAAAFAPS